MVGRVIFLLTFLVGSSISLSQPLNNSCSNAAVLCPGVLISGSNIGANKTFCPSCEDDFNFCFGTDNTIWYSFTTNAVGGAVQVDVSNLVFQANPGQDFELQATILEATVPCNSSSYTQIGNCVNNATGNFTLNAAGLAPNTQYMIVIDGDNNGAGITLPAEASFDIVINGPGVDRTLPSISISQSASSICANEAVFFAAQLSNCPDSGNYLWYINGVLVATTTDSVFITTGIQNGDIVTVENSCYSQCPVIVSQAGTAIQVTTVNVDAGPDVTISLGGQVSVFGQTTALTHLWEPTYLFVNPTALNTFCFPEQTITVSFSATENGCTAIDYLTITVLEDLDIPNTISPNGDNLNDTWEIEGIEMYPNNVVTIFDRWGQRVFQTSGYSKSKMWDGKIGTRGVTESVYFFVLDLYNDGSDVRKGTITVIY